jgi:hypothetical protein
MKNLSIVILAIAILFPIVTSAQHFGDTEDQVKSEMDNQSSYRFVKREYVKDNMPTLVYKSSFALKTFFFDNKGECCLMTEVRRLTDLEGLIRINDRNSSNVKTGDLTWINPSVRVKCEIIIYKDEETFQVVYSEIRD